MAAAPELLPEAEVGIEAVPQIGAIALLAVVLGFILAIDAIVRGLFGTLKGAVGWIPYLGKVLTAPITVIEHKVVSFLSGLEADVDSMMAHRIHQLARLVERFWRTLERLAVYTMLVGAIAAGATAHYVIGPIERFIRGLIRKVEAELHYVAHHLRGSTVVIRKTITHVCEALLMIEPYVSDVADFLIPPLTQVGAGVCKGSIGNPAALGGTTVQIPAVYGGTPGLPG